MNNNYHPEHGAFRPLEIELIRSATRGTANAKQLKQMDDLFDPPENNKDAFIVKPAASWLKQTQKQAPAAPLFGEFWFEGELCVLFADTNVGKSILAVQIGDSISSGVPIDNMEMRAEAATVLYCDFELTELQFRARYSGGSYGDYSFDPKFLRAVINPGSAGAQRFKTYNEFISNSLENSIISTQANVLIIDNITCLGHGTQAAGSALALMQHLQNLKRKYNLSVLVLAHTPKRQPFKPITRNDLQGSKMLLNFADSSFAIGESQTEPGTRYLKQIKQRNTGTRYGADNVYLCTIDKPFHMLRFTFTTTAHEYDHLAQHVRQSRQDKEKLILQLSREGKNYHQIGMQLGVAHTTVSRTLQRLQSKRKGNE